MDIKIILWLLFSHWIADFVCQSDWMAINKSKDLKALLSHVCTYTGVMLCLFWSSDNFFVPFFAITLTFLAHFTTDAITSNITSYLWAKEKRHWFFVVIGFDQFLHYLQLLLTYKWLSK